MPLGRPGHLATDGFLNCTKALATAGYLYCPAKRGGSSKRGGVNPFDVHAYRLKQEDEDVLAVIMAATAKFLH